MNRTLAECHKEIVDELVGRCEEVYNPCIKLMGGTPDVYVKGKQFRTREFICGTAIRMKNGTISIIPEPMADLVGFEGFDIKDLGLCDPVCYYANGDAKTYPLREPETETTRPLSETNKMIELTPERRVALVHAAILEEGKMILPNTKHAKVIRAMLEEAEGE